MIFKDVGKEFQALFNNAAIGIIIADPEGKIVLVNPFALMQFGYTEEEVIGNKVEMLIPPRFRDKHVHHRENYQGANAHSRPMGVGMDLYAIAKDKTEFPVEVSLSPYFTEKGQYAIAFISDISIRKQSEMALLELNAALEQKVEERTRSLSEALEKEKDLNELKSRFVSMASHQFRTPLSTIISSAFLISKYRVPDDQHKIDKHIQWIMSSGNMLNDILNDFLSVGKIEEGRIQVRFSEFDIQVQINNFIKEMQSILKNGQQLVYEHTGDSLVHLDLSLFRHIMMNLVSNAIKFSEEHSNIYIDTTQNSETLTIKVRDTGLGISPTDQEYLFQRFFRGENVTNIQGTGLGLHIVGKYVELMEGSIDFTSNLSAGTEFIIKFKSRD